MRIIGIILFLLAGVTRLSAQSDTAIFSFTQYMEVVLENHPRVFQAENKVKEGEANLLKSKGGFDPKLNAQIDQKQFDSKDYYSMLNGGLKIPTWFGMTLETGYKQADGLFLNPQENMPNAGLWNAGITLELGNGLFIDERRAELRKARLFKEATLLEKRVILNELIYEATQAYWSWQKSHRDVEVYERAMRNAEIRLEGVRGTVVLGERPAIDTVEAGLQFQNRNVSYNNALLKLKIAKARLELFLWNEGQIPLEINGLRPETNSGLIPGDVLSRGLENAQFLDQHPILELYNLKIQQSELNLRLKQEQLKPTLSLKYQAINEPLGSDLLANYSSSNYTWGGRIAYPIFTRKERGDVRLSRIKLNNLGYDQDLKTRELSYKVQVTLDKLQTALLQQSNLDKIANDYSKLYKAEKTLFEIGESNLFMINSREKALLDAQLRLIEIQNTVRQLENELNFNLMLTE